MYKILGTSKGQNCKLYEDLEDNVTKSYKHEDVSNWGHQLGLISNSCYFHPSLNTSESLYAFSCISIHHTSISPSRITPSLLLKYGVSFTSEWFPHVLFAIMRVRKMGGVYIPLWEKWGSGERYDRTTTSFTDQVGILTPHVYRWPASHPPC